jgi:surfactin synthase thioesterase subunit
MLNEQSRNLARFGAASCRQAILCIPHAGAGAAMFAAWGEALEDTASVWAARFPGRESLVLEQPLTALDALAGLLARAITQLKAAELTLFGHCSGALIAYELAHKMITAEDDRVARLIVSSQQAPFLTTKRQVLPAQVSDDFAVDFIKRTGGTDERALRDPEVLELLLPAIKADIEAIASYSPPPHREKLDIPVWAISGSSDPGLSQHELARWAEVTTGIFRLRQFEGDHFFLFSQADSVLSFLREVLTATR